MIKSRHLRHGISGLYDNAEFYATMTLFKRSAGVVAVWCFG